MMLAALAMLGPFTVDTYLPAFPDIAASLKATQLQVQQTLTAYMFFFAVMILWHGAISDALGRRAVILVSLAAFVVASLGCAASHSIEYLWAFRVLQGLSAGAGVVVGRAMIRDTFEGPAAQRLLSLVTMIFSIAPAIAPVIGGWMIGWFPWRSIFLLLFALSAALLVWCWRRLPETLPLERRHPLDAGMLAGHYRRVFLSMRFQLLAATISFNFAGLFLYVAAAPVFVIQHMKLGPHQFAWQFVPSVSGIFLGALCSNRMAGRMEHGRQLRIAFATMLGAALCNVVYHLLMPPMVPWSVLPLFFYCLGFSMSTPVLTLFIFDLFPNIRGLVASCQSFTQTMLSSAVAGLLAPMLWSTVLMLAVGQLGLLAIGLICWTLASQKESRGRHPA